MDCAKKKKNISEDRKLFKNIFLRKNLNILSTKYQLYPKSTKIDTFEQKNV